jgi:hypothetical protein
MSTPLYEPPMTSPAPPGPAPPNTEIKDNMPSFGNFMMYIFLGIVGIICLIFFIHAFTSEVSHDAKVYGFANKFFSDSSSLINLTATPYML